MGNRITRCFSHGLAMNLAAPPRNPTISIVGGVKPQEFRERNTFYNTLGYKVAWVFDVSDKGIVPTIGKDGLPDYFHLYWERPLSVLRFGPVPQQDSVHAWVSICFYFGTIV